MRRTGIQLLNGLMLVLFTVAAVAQYNDPDPVLWVCVYGAGALCCALFLVDRLPVLFSGIVAGLCLLSALYLLVRIVFGPMGFLDETGQAMLGLVEETREMFGFLITALWAGFLTWRVRQPEHTASSSQQTIS